MVVEDLLEAALAAVCERGRVAREEAVERMPAILPCGGPGNALEGARRRIRLAARDVQVRADHVGERLAARARAAQED